MLALRMGLGRLFSIAATQSQTPSETPVAGRFLNKKPAEMFGISDRLKYRCITLIDAKGFLRHVGALWQMGLLGWWCYREVSQLDEAGKEALRKEYRFYEQCCRVQGLYQRCFRYDHDCYATPADIQTFKQAYEALLAFAEGNAQQQNKINTILNKRCANGSSVSTALVERLMLDRLFAGVSTGRPFLDEIRRLHEMGYQCDISREELAVVKQLLANNNVADEKIREILNDALLAPIFVACGRAYKRAVRSGHQTLPDGQAERAMATDNALILAMIQGREPVRAVSVVTAEEITQMKELCSQYLADEEKLGRSNTELSQLIEQRDGCQRTFSLDELVWVIHENSNLAMVKEVKERNERQLRLQVQIQEQGQIEADLKPLREQLDEISTMTLTDEQIIAIYEEAHDRIKKSDIAQPFGKIAGLTQHIVLAEAARDAIAARLDSAFGIVQQFGFQINDEGDLTDAGFHCSKLKLSQYEDEVPLSTNIMKALHVVTYSPDYLRLLQSALSQGG